MWEMEEARIRSLSREDPLQEEMATHSSILAWRIPWREEPDGLQSMRLPRVGHDWATEHCSIHCGREVTGRGQRRRQRCHNWIWMGVPVLQFVNFIMLHTLALCRLVYAHYANPKRKTCCFFLKILTFLTYHIGTHPSLTAWSVGKTTKETGALIYY